MIFETATQKFCHALLNKSQFKVFLKAKVFLDHKCNELEGFWCWSQSLRWEADAWALSVSPVCSTSPTGCFPAVELLGCTLSEVKDLCERFEQSAAAALRVLLRCCYTSISCPPVPWSAWFSFEIDLDFHILPSNCYFTVSSLEHMRY